MALRLLRANSAIRPLRIWLLNVVSKRSFLHIIWMIRLRLYLSGCCGGLGLTERGVCVLMRNFPWQTEAGCVYFAPYLMCVAVCWSRMYLNADVNLSLMSRMMIRSFFGTHCDTRSYQCWNQYARVRWKHSPDPAACCMLHQICSLNMSKRNSICVRSVMP